MISQEQLNQRLEALNDELKKGQQQLVHLDRQRIETQQTLIRISGAIQLIEELLKPQQDDNTTTKIPRVAAVE